MIWEPKLSPAIQYRAPLTVYPFTVTPSFQQELSGRGKRCIKEPQSQDYAQEFVVLKGEKM